MADQSSITVSIITPCYNGARFIEQTIDSVLAQTRPALEMIVIDDGSTDDSAARAGRFAPPVRVLRQHNQGESVARNRGIAEAAGSHVLFLDADDLLAPEALQHLSAALEGRPRSVAMMGCARFTEDPAQPTSIVSAEIEQFFPTVIDTNFGPPHVWMAPLDIIRAVGGFYEPMRWSEDWDIVWRMGLHADGVIPVDYVGALYRIHPASQFSTNSMANRCRGHAAIMARMIVGLSARPDLLAIHGVRLFWAARSAISRAREYGVSWTELAPLTDAISALVRTGPDDVRRLKLARLVSLVGARTASLFG